MKNVMIEVAGDGKVSACNSRQVASPLAFWAAYTLCVFNPCCLKVVMDNIYMRLLVLKVNINEINTK